MGESVGECLLPPIACMVIGDTDYIKARSLERGRDCKTHAKGVNTPRIFAFVRDWPLKITEGDIVVSKRSCMSKKRVVLFGKLFFHHTLYAAVRHYVSHKKKFHFVFFIRTHGPLGGAERSRETLPCLREQRILAFFFCQQWSRELFYSHAADVGAHAVIDIFGYISH